jgi:hypothetical protein
VKLKPSDSSFADYVARRRTFMLALNATDPTPRERLGCMRKWLEANSPLSPSEKLANLRRALLEDDHDD